MLEHLSVEPVVDHEYRVSVSDGDNSAECEFVVDPRVLAEMGFDIGDDQIDEQIDEQMIVEHTARFLAEHQAVIDFPSLVYLDDVAAAYHDFPDSLRHRLGCADPTGQFGSG